MYEYLCPNFYLFIFVPQTNTAYQTKINYLIELKVLKVTEICTVYTIQQAINKLNLYDYMYSTYIYGDRGLMCIL